MEEADLRTAWFRQYVLKPLDMTLIPPPWGSAARISAGHLNQIHLLPWFDTTFFINPLYHKKNVKSMSDYTIDCLHFTFQGPQMAAAMFDAIFWAAHLGQDNNKQASPLYDLEHPRIVYKSGASKSGWHQAHANFAEMDKSPTKALKVRNETDLMNFIGLGLKW